MRRLQFDKKFLYWLLIIVPILTITSCNLPSPTEDIPVTEAAPAREQFSQPIFGVEERNFSADIFKNVLEDLNPNWIRRNGVLWSEIEPTEGERNWATQASLEEDLKKAAQLDLEPILIVRSTPSWAQASDGLFCGPIREDRLPAFREFMEDLVSRYSAPPFNVHYWEIWNEPDVDPQLISPTFPFGCWGDPEDDFYGGGRYARMLAAVVPAIKAADPTAQVIIGGLLLDCDPRNPPEITPGSENLKDCSSSNFLEGILKENGGAYFDGISFHAYDYFGGEMGLYSNINWHSNSLDSGPVLIAKADYLQATLAKYGVQGKYLMNTEMAILCGSTGEEDFCQAPTYLQTKASYLTQSYAAAMAADLRANIWFTIRGWRGSRLLDQQMTPEPAYRAYQFARNILGPARYVEAINQFSGLDGHRFQLGVTDVWLLWSPTNEEIAIELPEQPSRIHNMYGEQLPDAQQLVIGAIPIYIFWEG